MSHSQPEPVSGRNYGRSRPGITLAQTRSAFTAPVLEFHGVDIPFTRPAYDGARLEEQFKALAKKWREETGAESSLSKITANLNYLRVISLGHKAVPLILKELQREPAPWFTALRAITGETEIGKQHAGNFSGIAESWIRWGAEHGYI